MEDDTTSESNDVPDGWTEEELKNRLLLIIGLFFFGGVLGAIIYPDSAIYGFMLGSFILGGSGFLFGTPQGQELLEDPSDVLAQIQELDPDAEERGSKQICTNCGWQNPSENSYCHDCGEELGNVDNGPA